MVRLVDPVHTECRTSRCFNGRLYLLYKQDNRVHSETNQAAEWVTRHGTSHHWFSLAN